jgi:MoaA/NifB/PqqE/SkfB family radical SAM enzyme
MVEAGVSSVNLSIDGTEAAHDELRGVPGSWRRAFAALENLQAAGARRAVNTQINRVSLAGLEVLQEDLIDAGIRAWQLQITSPFGNAADHPEILLQPYMYRDGADAHVLEAGRDRHHRVEPLDALLVGVRAGSIATKSQKGWQQPWEPCMHALEALAVLRQTRPLSQALANSQGSLVLPISPEASRTQMKPSPLGMQRSSPGQS